MPSLTPVEYDPFAGVYDDTQAPFDQQRIGMEQLERQQALNRVPFVLPPEASAEDARMPMSVISPEMLQDRVFHPSDYLPPSYGAGRYRLFTPTQGYMNEVFKRSFGKELLDMMK